MMLLSLFIIFLGLQDHRTLSHVVLMQQTRQDACDFSSENARFDCYPGPGANQQGCESRGCCWRQSTSPRQVNDINVPYCYFPSDYQGYSIDSINKTDYGYSAHLARQSKSGWPDDVVNLRLDIYFYKMYLRFKLTDASNARYQVPVDTPPPPSSMPNHTDYHVDIVEKPFSIKVTRKSTGAVMFDSSVAPVIFADQFIQISTRLSTGKLYGLGEHKDRLLHTADSWSQRSFWARDIAPVFNSNLYGDHPFYLEFEGDGTSHGVFLLNSNAMDVDIQPLPALTFRTIGGIIDISVFVGPTPDDVVQQYSSVIGKPAMPPYWALGFHLCKYGYGSSDELKKVIERNRALRIPYDTQWTDIDYMDKYLDWTYDKNKFVDLPAIVKDLHDNDQHYVIIVDPGISNVQSAGTYPPYDDGIKQDIFVKNATGQVLIGKVWPGNTAFPDFSHPNAPEWWYQQANAFHQQLPFDGLWTDMNEPSDFVTGSLLKCTNNKYDNPPYTPGVNGNLQTSTICPSAQQHLSSHYNMHSMYGHFEVIATQKALERMTNKRSLVISRSTFPSTGHYGGHWSGDISSTWEDLRYSIPDMLEFQMYSIPLMGADICGFLQNTTEEMCIRWMQLGAFYPFMRNHNSIGQMDQDPAVFSHEAQDIMRSALMVRYSLLPYLYSLFYATHVTGRPHVVRPLSFQYPADSTTYGIDEQFMWGSSLLISPALYENQTQVHAYFPGSVWYDVYISKRLEAGWHDLPTPLHQINLHIRGGSIIVLQAPEVTTVKARKNPFMLFVALDEQGTAMSDVPLYWDDGETIDAFSKNTVTTIWFKAANKQLISQPKVQYRPEGGMPLTVVRILGVDNRPSAVTVNGNKANFTWSDVGELMAESIKADLMQPLMVEWK